MSSKNTTKQHKGGIARSEALSQNERTSIAKKAAMARWSNNNIARIVPEASHQSFLLLGDLELEVYVLEDGRRLFNKRAMAKILNLKSEGGNAFIKTISGKTIGSSIPKELWDKIKKPILFKTLNGDPSHGFEASVLIEICDSIMQARDDLAENQKFLARQAEIIIRSAAKVGIVALIDEATGYADNKRKEEYRELFQEFIRGEFRQWEQEVPEKFFDMIYKLYGLKRKDPSSTKHPSFFGNFIRKYVYFPLANSNGAILEELDKKNPVVYASGGRKYKFHQFLADEVGLPAFRAHLWQVVGIGASATDKDTFDRAFYRAFPEAIPKKKQEQLDLFIY